MKITDRVINFLSCDKTLHSPDVDIKDHPVPLRKASQPQPKAVRVSNPIAKTSDAVHQNAQNPRPAAGQKTALNSHAPRPVSPRSRICVVPDGWPSIDKDYLHLASITEMKQKFPAARFLTDEKNGLTIQRSKTLENGKRVVATENFTVSENGIVHRARQQTIAPRSIVDHQGNDAGYANVVESDVRKDKSFKRVNVTTADAMSIPESKRWYADASKDVLCDANRGEFDDADKSFIKTTYPDKIYTIKNPYTGSSSKIDTWSIPHNIVPLSYGYSQFGRATEEKMEYFKNADNAFQALGVNQECHQLKQ